MLRDVLIDDKDKILKHISDSALALTDHDVMLAHDEAIDDLRRSIGLLERLVRYVIMCDAEHTE